MPPKAKFTKEEIIDAALQITRTRGMEAITARDVAAQLGVSTRPIFTYSSTMEEVRREVYASAERLYSERIARGLQNRRPFLGIGVEYLRFAQEEPQLYRILFLTRPADANEGAITAMRSTQNEVRASVMREYKMTAREADRFFRDMWIVAHGLATLLVTNGECYSMDEMRAMLTGFSASICRSIKEVAGYVDDKIDRDAEFARILGKSEGGE